MPRRRWIPWALTAVCYGLAFGQRPGDVVADTKVHLYVAPARFLHDVLSVWSPTNDLGHVWGGQYNGYLFPMGPWFVAGDALGIPTWVVHRLWLGTLLALAAYGMVRLLDALHSPRRGPAHLVAGAVYVVNPYVAVYADRTSVALLAYAALPWMLLCVHRGLRDPRGWWWPAAFALILTSTGGGVNAAVTGWVLLGPALLVLYERRWGELERGAIRRWLPRMALTNVLASAWWVVPVLVHSAHGLNFLPFTEQPGTIWGTTSLPESLRLMGFWTSYIGVGFGGHLLPFAGHGDVLLFNTKVVIAGLLVPALALAGFAWTRRLRYGPWFMLLTLTGLVVMVAGWPEGTPLRHGLTFAYNHVQAVQFLRTTYKAGPLVALGLAALAGLAFAALWARLPRRRVLGPAVALAAAGLVALAAWPLTSGRAPDRQLAFDVPQAWRQLARDLDRRGDHSRALVLPGQLFAFSRDGGTIDALLPALAKHRVATRYIVPFADLRSVDLQWTVDALVSQERLLPGQLRPLLDLMGVGDVVLAADQDRGRGGGLGAAETARLLASQLDRGQPYGGPLTAPAAAGRIAGPARLPRATDVPTGTGGLLRVLPRGPLTVVDGSAPTLAGLAAFGALTPDRPYAYAADLDAGRIRAAAGDGATFVIGDANRRQAFIAARLRGSTGAVLPADQDVSEDGTMLDPFKRTTTPTAAAQTVAVLDGVRSVTSPFSPQVTQFPEHRPFAALDGDLGTAWLADRFLAPERHHLDVAFERPRDVPAIELFPYSDSRGRMRAVAVNGRRFAVHGGWNRLPVRLRAVRRLSILMADVRRPRRASAGAGGIRELRIPGVHAREVLRPPVVLERALHGVDLGRSVLSYLLDRQSADDPFHHARLSGEQQAGLARDARDPEAQLARTLTPPAARQWRAEGWVRPDPTVSDAALDRIAGVSGTLRATSSSRYDGLPRYRASGAFDGGRRRAWIGQWIAGRPAWLAWRTPQPVALRRLVLERPGVRVRTPTRVRLTVDGRGGPVVAVGAGGVVVLPVAVRGRDFRLDVVAARFAAGTPARIRQRRAVGIGELRAPGLPRLAVPRTGALSTGCAAAAFRIGRPLDAGAAAPPGPHAVLVGMSVTADLPSFDAGRPLRARACGPAVSLPASRVALRGAARAFTIDHLRLRSPALGGVSVVPGLGGTVDDPGRSDGSTRTGIRVRAEGRAWLVDGESYDDGWRATCDGRDLGKPVPMQGYANAWPIDPPGCRRAELRYAPDRLVTPTLIGSAACCLLLLVLLVVRRRRREHAAPDASEVVEAAVLRRVSVPAAVGLGLVVALVVGFVFAVRAGVVAGPLVALVLWRGVPTRALILLAGVALGVVVPVLYVVVEPRDPGGYDTAYATQHLAAHWVSVGAFVALGVALARTLAARRSERAARPDAGG